VRTCLKNRLKIKKKRKIFIAKHQWLMPAILATRQAEIWRIEVQSQSRQIVHAFLSQKNQHKKGLTERVKWYSACGTMSSSPSTINK
jgi:hypothetical protein